MEVEAGGQMRHLFGGRRIVEIDGLGVAKFGKHGFSADGHPYPPGFLEQSQLGTGLGRYHSERGIQAKSPLVKIIIISQGAGIRCLVRLYSSAMSAMRVSTSSGRVLQLVQKRTQ